MNDISRELIEQLDKARADKNKINIIGRGTKTFMGRAAQGKAINIAKHSGIIDYHPKELVMTARAGTLLADMTATLDEEGQMLAFEPPRFDNQASIGGTLACNLSGPGRPWYGSVRDMVLGIRLINGKSEHLRFGGQVMKNVAGYDVSRLQAGAMGCLGIITEVSLKVLPKPSVSVTLVQALEPEEAIRTMNELSAQAKPLTAACWLEGKLYLRLAGAKNAVEATAELWPGQEMDDADKFWSDLRDLKLDYFSGDVPLWRFSMKSSAQHILPDAAWLIDWGGGQRWLRGDFNHMELQRLASDVGGHVSLFRGGDRSGEVHQQQAEALVRIHQRLKAAFDPDGLFNPGRLYSWL